MDWMNNLNEWLLNPLVRGALLTVGGWLLVKQGSLVKKAVPVVLLICSSLITVVQTAFPSLVPDANAAVAAAVVHSIPWWKHALVVVTSTLVAVGLHSGPKNTKEWVETGMELIR